MIKVPVSVGELIDKLSILLIKKNNVIDKTKLGYVENEYNVLLELSDTYLDNQEIKKRYDELIIVNSKLWEIEDKIRELEYEQNFGTEFIDCARKVYLTNDERFRIKNLINQISNSEIKEIKNYTNYTK